MSDRERRISDLAYRIWEEAGQPEGQDDRHWSEAERRYAAEQAGDAVPAKPTRAGAKAVKPVKGAAAGKSTKADKPAKAVAVKPDRPKAAEPKPAASKAAAAPSPAVAKVKKPKADVGPAKAEPPKAKGRGKAKG